MSADEGHVFHNRLTHSLQVAQVGRRIAEKLTRDARLTGCALPIDPDVTEAACLAHDLGHPPFGHIAERRLDELAKGYGASDGFEGNAQSFRIVTRLAMGSKSAGLNLTRATLNALLKYPWLRGKNPRKADKWGAYNEETEYFDWARELGPAPLVKSMEAELMDWADDVTYSVHDLDDFYRAGVIPLDRLVVDEDERERFYDEVFDRCGEELPIGMDQTYLKGAFDELMTKLPIRTAYQSSQKERVRLRQVTSTLIGDFVRAVQVESTNGQTISIAPKRRAEVFMLKQLTWHYVIKNPALATQQEGQRNLITTLFETYFKALNSKPRPNPDLFPLSVRELLPPMPLKSAGKTKAVMVILDFIASLTEEQAVATCHRLTGVALGSSLVHRVR